jgi:hypothetical protein
VVRFHPVTVSGLFRVANTHHDQLESMAYRFEMSNGLSATGVWIKEVSAGNHAPVTIVINDKGKKGSATEIWDRVPEVARCLERGDHVLAVDLLGMGDAASDQPFHLLSEMLAATGERPLGIEAAQLVSLAHWAQEQWSPSQIRLEGTGPRSQMIAVIASALEPRLFARIELHGGMRNLHYLLDKPVKYEDAPDLFCLDLYKDFDLEQLVTLAEPGEVIQRGYLELPAQGK